MADPLDNVSLLRPQTVGAQVNPSAAAAPALASGNVGRALQDVGQAGFDIAQRIQATKNSGQLADLRRQMRETRAEFDRSLQEGEIDEGEWLDRWHEAADNFQARASEQGMPPVVRDEFARQFADYRSQSAQEIANSALTRSLERAKQRHLNAADQALMNGDLATYEREVDAMPDTTPEAREKIKMAGRQRYAYDAAESDAWIDPDAILTGERPGDVSESDWGKISRLAERNKDRFVADEMEQYLGMIGDGKIKTEAELERQLESAAWMEDEDKESVRRGFKLSSPMSGGEMSAWRDRLAELRQFRQNATPRAEGFGAAIMREQGLERSELSERAYEEKYNKLRRELMREGRRPGADDLRQELAGMSPDNLSHLERERNKSKRQVHVEAGAAWFADRMRNLDNEDLGPVRTYAEDGFRAWLDRQDSPEKLQPEEILAKAKFYWNQSLREFEVDKPTTWAFPSDETTPPLPTVQPSASGPLDSLLPPR